MTSQTDLQPLFTPRVIGVARSPYRETLDVPRGPGTRHDAEGTIELDSDFVLGLTHIEGFSHLFVLWVFHRSERFELLGKPPGEEIEHGVFATRSPRRPNPIGLTLVQLLRRDSNVLHIRGVDMLDGTPILDIKPCMSSPPIESLRRGWLSEAEARRAKPSV